MNNHLPLSVILKSRDQYFYYALLYRLALRAKWICRPNPAVAALVVKDRRIISWGFTQPVGGEHAEYQALIKSGKKLSVKGAHLYVTLMPCCFQGRTKPCTDVILQSGIRHIHVAGFDNDPRMLSRDRGCYNYLSEKIFRRAGIQLYYDCPQEIAKKLFFLNWDYFKKNAVNLPTLTLKYAMTLDGKIAGPSLPNQKKIMSGKIRGETKVSGELIRSKTHNLRAQHDAVLVGGNTLRNDDPHLNVRMKVKSFQLTLEDLARSCDPLNMKPYDSIDLVELGEKLDLFPDKIDKKLGKEQPFIGLHSQILQPTPMILSRSPQPPELYLMKNKKSLFLVPSFSKKFFSNQKKILFSQKAREGKWEHQAHTWIYRGGTPQDSNFWKDLAEEFGIYSVFLEGGAGIQSYLWETGLLDRVHIYISPRFFLQENALSPFTEPKKKGLWRTNLKDQMKLMDLWQSQTMVWGQDVEVSGFIDYPNNRLAQKLWRQLFPTTKMG